MKKITMTLLLLFAAIVHAEKTYASHAAAGEIMYRWIADSTYRFYFTFYRDCSGITENDTVRLCFDNTCNSSLSFTTLLNKVNGPNGITQPGCTQYKNQCDSPASNVRGYIKWAYTGLVTMPARCSAWRISGVVDTRNPVPNLGYGMSPFYVEAMMNNTGSYQGNSSPDFIAWGIYNACINQQSAYNNGAIDPDGDSLYYAPIMSRTIQTSSDCNFPPFDNTYANASPYPPYNILYNPIQTNNSFSMHPYTGMMTFMPSQLGAGVISTRVREYRNGVLIGYVDRDIQVQVNQCSAAAPVFNVSTPGVVQGCVGQPMNFCWWVKSPNITTKLVSSDNHMATLPGSSVTYQLQATDSVRGCLSWTPGAIDKGWHTLSITVKDSTCDASGIMPYYYYNIRVFVVGGAFASNDTAICPGNPVQLTTAGTGPFTWSVISGSPNSLSCTNCQSPVATPAITTKYEVVLSSAVGCSNNKDTVTVTALPVNKPSVAITVAPDTNVAPGTMVTFTATPTNCNNPTYQWRRNGNNLPGAVAATFSNANLVNKDVITVKMQCTDTCLIDTPSNKLTMHIGTGIETIGLSTIAIHPNPNTGEFTISGYAGAEEIAIEIVNITGQVIFRQSNIATVNGNIEYKLNASNLSNGNYMLRIKTAGKIFIQRLAIQR